MSVEVETEGRPPLRVHVRSKVRRRGRCSELVAWLDSGDGVRSWRHLDAGFATVALVAVVRRQEWNKLRSARQAQAAKEFKGLRFLLRRNWEKLTVGQREVIWALETANRRTFRAFQLKEELRDIFALPLLKARRALDDWLADASRSKLAPFVKLVAPALSSIWAARPGLIVRSPAAEGSNPGVASPSPQGNIDRRWRPPNSIRVVSAAPVRRQADGIGEQALTHEVDMLKCQGPAGADRRRAK
jgi:hypothetical protein